MIGAGKLIDKIIDRASKNKKSFAILVIADHGPQLLEQDTTGYPELFYVINSNK